VHDDDARMDQAHEAYQRARTPSARVSALHALLVISEGFIGRYVRHISRGALRELDREDAMQAARLGFVDAVHRFDGRKGPLRPYAMHRIRHELQSATEKNYTIKIPRRAGLPAAVLRQAEITFTRDGREPTHEELNGHAQAWEQAKDRPRVVTSFDAILYGDDNNRSLHEKIAGGDQDALSRIIDTERDEFGVRARLSDIVGLPIEGTMMLAEQVPSTEIEALNAALTPLRQLLSSREERKEALRRSRRERADALQREIAEIDREIEAVDAADRTMKTALARALGVGAVVDDAPRSLPRARRTGGAGKRGRKAIAKTVPSSSGSLPGRVLARLNGKSACASDLAKELGAKPTAVSMALRRLEARGEVTRSGDGRQIVYSAA
jgi:DNA-directed RNA polymerase specialized sigma subunit